MVVHRCSWLMANSHIHRKSVLAEWWYFEAASCCDSRPGQSARQFQNQRFTPEIGQTPRAVARRSWLRITVRQKTKSLCLYAVCYMNVSEQVVKPPPLAPGHSQGTNCLHCSWQNAVAPCHHAKKHTPKNTLQTLDIMALLQAKQAAPFWLATGRALMEKTPLICPQVSASRRTSDKQRPRR